jgi:O-antigen ligase
MSYWRRQNLPFLTVRVLLIFLALLTVLVSVAWGITRDSLVGVTLLFAGVYVGFIIWYWMSGAIWRPALVLLIQVPFQGMLGLYLGNWSNLLTWIPIVAFVLQVPRSEILRTFSGSVTQRLAITLIVAILFSALIAIPHADLSNLLRDSGQKVTLIFIVAVLARAFLEPGFDRKALVTVSVSMTIMVALALMEHYLGLSIVGSAPKEFRHLGDYRLSGLGGSLPINRMAFYHILPIGLVLGSLPNKQTRPNLLIVFALTILGLGLISTGSRGGLLGALFALGLVWWFSRARIRSGILIGMLILAGLVIMSTIVPPEAFLRSEGAGLTADAGDRLAIWNRALDYFVRNPILGLGWGQLDVAIVRADPYMAARMATTAHNSLLQMLSESGLVGTIPFILLCWHVLTVLWRCARRNTEPRSLLSVGVFAAFAGMLLATMTSVYQFERYFWVPIAFAASLELRRTRMPVSVAQDDRSSASI